MGLVLLAQVVNPLAKYQQQLLELSHSVQKPKPQHNEDKQISSSQEYLGKNTSVLLLSRMMQAYSDSSHARLPSQISDIYQNLL